MTCPPSKAKFQLRRDTSGNWRTVNPVILSGEPGYETDSNKLKIGDGIRRWVDLPYIGNDECPLVFTASGDIRTLTGYKENNTTFTVRSADLNGNMFRLNLASFTPVLTATALPSSSLNWDDRSTGFSVSVSNPSDFPSQYIDELKSIVASTGSISQLSQFTTGTKSAVPSGGINWSQTFLANTSAFIYSPSTTIQGGSVSSTLTFTYKSSSTSSTVYGNTIPLTITWVTPVLALNVTGLSGRTFLETYTSTPYSISVSGISNPSNYSHTVTSVGGTISNTSGNGIFTFNQPVHKDNLTLTRRVLATTTFTRPAYVTGISYTAQLNTDNSPTISFRYPSFWIFTNGASIVPNATNIVNGDTFHSNVTLLGDQSRTMSTFINNSSGVPQAFWIAVVSTAAQPSSFKTGASPSLLSDVAVMTGNTVNLEPSPKPSGYNSVQYKLYGITLQNGSTYVSIT